MFNYSPYLLFNLITFDSLYSAFNFLYINYNAKRLYQIENNEQLYQLPIIDRYLLYIIINLFYFLLDYFFITNLSLDSISHSISHSILQYPLICALLTIFTSPFIINNIIVVYCKYFIDKFQILKNRIVKSIYKEFFYSIFYTVCDYHNILINKPLFFNHTLHLLDHIDYYQLMCKMIVVYVMLYIREFNRSYYKLLKYIYFYNYNTYFQYILDPKKYVLDTLVSRNFGNLFTDDGIQSILQLSLNSRNNNFFVLLQYKFTFMISLWSLLGVALSQCYLIVLVILLLNYSNFFKYNSISSVLWTNIPLCLLLVTDNLCLISFISQFGLLIFNNRFIKNNIKKLLNICYKIIKIIHYDSSIFIKNSFFAFLIKICMESNNKLFILSLTQYTTLLNIVGILLNNDIKLLTFIYLYSIFENYTHYKDVNFNVIPQEECSNSGGILENDSINCSIQKQITINTEYFCEKDDECDDYVCI